MMGHFARYRAELEASPSAGWREVYEQMGVDGALDVRSR